MRKIYFLFLLILIIVSTAFMYWKHRPLTKPTSSNVQPTPTLDMGLLNYDNSKYNFSLKYSNNFTEASTAQDSANYIPLCDHSPSSTKVACFVLNKDFYKNSNFEGASVSIETEPTATSADQCDNAATATLQGTQTPPVHETLNGINYFKGSYGNAAAGHQLTGEGYYTFQSGTCFGIFTSIFSSTFENYPQGSINKFTDVQRQETTAKLQNIIKSVSFR